MLAPLLALVLLAHAPRVDTVPAPPPAPVPAHLVLTAPDDSVLVDYSAWSAELKMSGPSDLLPVGTRARGMRTAAELRLTGPAQNGAALTRLVQRFAQRAAGGELTMGDGPSAVRLRLASVTVTSATLRTPSSPTELEDAVTNTESAADDLGMQRDEAARRLSEAEALAKRQLVSTFDLANARARVASLDRRLLVARHRVDRARADLAAHSGPALDVVIRIDEVTLLAEPAAVTAAQSAP